VSVAAGPRRADPTTPGIDPSRGEAPLRLRSRLPRHGTKSAATGNGTAVAGPAAEPAAGPAAGPGSKSCGGCCCKVRVATTTSNACVRVLARPFVAAAAPAAAAAVGPSVAAAPTVKAPELALAGAAGEGARSVASPGQGKPTRTPAPTSAAVDTWRAHTESEAPRKRGVQRERERERMGERARAVHGRQERVREKRSGCQESARGADRKVTKTILHRPGRCILFILLQLLHVVPSRLGARPSARSTLQAPPAAATRHRSTAPPPTRPARSTARPARPNSITAKRVAKRQRWRRQR